MARRNKGPKAARHTASAAQAVPAAAAPAARANYDAAGHGRRMKGWVAPSSGPNRAIKGLETLRNRANDAARNEAAAASAGRVWKTNLIGIGITCRPETPDPDLVRLWDDWTPYADADGVLPFYGLQTLATAAWKGAGEVLVRARPRRPEDGLAVPIQFELLEGAQLPIFDADAWPGMPRGHRIRQGIQLDPIGRRVGYWLYKEHPGDTFGAAVSLADLTFVPAADIYHLYEPLRPKQLRGVPEQSPILAKLRSVSNFDDATLLRQELGNLFLGIIERPERKAQLRSNPDGTQEWLDALTGMPLELDAQGAPMIAFEPGTFQETAPGEKVTFTRPPDAGANYADFMRWQHMQIAAGSGGIPYELLTGDIRDVSDRALRIILNEFRRLCEQQQWQLLIPLLQWIRNHWVKAAVIAGAITPAQADTARRVVWSPHAWPYIHPTQDVQARKMEQDAGFRSRDEIISTHYGNDPAKTDLERQRAAAREKELQIGPYAAPQQPTPPTA